MIQVPFICMESVKTTFEASFAFCIPCEYFIWLEDRPIDHDDHDLARVRRQPMLNGSRRLI